MALGSEAPQPRGMALRTRKLENVGVEVLDFDLTEPITDDLRTELGELWNEHAILLFRGQHIDARRQIEFSRIFGPLESHPLETTRSSEHPELFELVNGGPGDAFQTAFYHGREIVGRLDWHMDLHYTGRPNRGAVIRAVEIADADGETGFGDLAKAYAALPAALKQRIEGLEVVYRFTVQRRKMRFVDLEGYEPGPGSPTRPSDMGFPDFPDAAYPIVVTHPVTGVPVLEVVEQFLDRVVDPASAGMNDAEADALLHELVAHTRKPEFHYFHAWEPGDMVLWDNWRAMHCTRGTAPGVRRVINRTTIEGDATLGRAL